MPPPPPEILPWLKSLPSAPEFHPSWAEFQDPISYIHHIEPQASLFGICKIVPPVPPAPPSTAVSNLTSSTFTTRQQQIGFCPRRSRRPVQRPVWQSGLHYSLAEFETKAKAFETNFFDKKQSRSKNKKNCHVSSSISALEIETMYWKATLDKPFTVEYANDMAGSAFAPLSLKQPMRMRRRRRKNKTGEDGISVGETPWNMRGVSRWRGSLLRFMKEEIPGVTCPMVYVAMMFSWFAWHVEDHDLHSLNYLHFGAGKTWYGVPGEAAVAFEEVVRVEGYGGEVNPLVTFATLGEKNTVMSPEVFVSSGIPCCRLVQNPGEFVVTFPRAYHTGFSHGFNCGEAANIATPQWLRVANAAAVRRASINYPPMVSHFQLLYDLALALCSRTTLLNSAEPRSSRLKDKKKGDGETVVKGLFVKNVIQNNELLHVLGKGSSVVLLPQSSSDITVFSKLRVGSQLIVNPDGPFIERHQGIKQVSLKGKLASFSETSRHLLFDAIDSAPTASKMLNMNAKRENNVDKEGLSDQRLFSCVTCGILSFSCVAIVQPRVAAARYLMSADRSSFNDSAIDCEPLQSGNGYPDSSKKGPRTGLKRKTHPAGIDNVPGQSADNQNQITDPSNEVDSNTETQKDSNALCLLALTYGDSSDIEEEQADQDSSSLHVFCLEHAIEVEQQLRSIGGAHILLLCHPDYPRIVDEAKDVAEELGVNYSWNDLAFRNATKVDEQRIQSALDSEEAIAGNGDWTVKMGINLFYSASRSRSHLYSKQMPYNSVIYSAFGRNSSATSLAGDAVCGRSAKQKKVVAGKWCGKVWMSNQVHSLLLKREHEHNNVAQQQRRLKESPMRDEKLEGNTDSTREAEKATVIKQYYRKRRRVVGVGTDKKEKDIGREASDREEAALDDTSDDNTALQPTFVRGKQIKLETTLQQMKQEIPQLVRQGSRRLQECQQQTPRFRSTMAVHNEEPECGPSMRLRKRPPKEHPETCSRKKAKQQQQTGRIKVHVTSAQKPKKNDSAAKLEEAEFSCNIEGCTMSFVTKRELNLHKKNMCPVKGCGKEFFSHKYLVQHRRVHEDDRPLRCPWKGCKMTFKWVWARTEHIRVHTGARPYICGEPACGQTFRFVSDFSRHRRKTGHSVKQIKGR